MGVEGIKADSDFLISGSWGPVEQGAMSRVLRAG